MGALKAVEEELEYLSGPRYPARRHDICVVLVVRNEADILPAFLDHYRTLGVNRFVVADNESLDGTREFLETQPDVTLYAAHGSYRLAFCGVAWSNFLADRYCARRWTIVVDADEFLILPEGFESLHELTTDLEMNLEFGLYAPILDFFPENFSPREGGMWESFEALVREAPHFMPFRSEYMTRVENFPFQEIRLSDRGIRVALGGRTYDVRLSKVPLVFWRPGFRFTKSTHESHMLPLSRRTAILAHFKFRPGFNQRYRMRMWLDDRHNPQALEAYVEPTGKVHVDETAVREAQMFTDRQDLVRAGWLDSIERPLPPDSMPEIWRANERTRKLAFEILAESTEGWTRIDDAEAARIIRMYWRRLTRYRSVRATRWLRRFLHARGLLRPEYMPEEMHDVRQPAELLVTFYNSFWWDIVSPVRMLGSLRTAIRWRRLFARYRRRNG